MSEPNQPAPDLGPRFLSGLVWGQIGMSGRTLVTFVISIIVARALGAENFGVYAALSTLTDMTIRFTEMGIGTVLNKWIPELSHLRPGQCSYLVRKVEGGPSIDGLRRRPKMEGSCRLGTGWNNRSTHRFRTPSELRSLEFRPGSEANPEFRAAHQFPHRRIHLGLEHPVLGRSQVGSRNSDVTLALLTP